MGGRGGRSGGSGILAAQPLLAWPPTQARLPGGWRPPGIRGAVSCPQWRVGRLYVPPGNWDQFTAGDGITWYWPDGHGVDTDGTLHVKATGGQGGSHWTGEQAISPA